MRDFRPRMWMSVPVALALLSVASCVGQSDDSSGEYQYDDTEETKARDSHGARPPLRKQREPPRKLAARRRRFEAD